MEWAECAMSAGSGNGVASPSPLASEDCGVN